MDKISIIIACYNCSKTLKESVSSCYQQNLDIPFEIILVNDCSTDNTWGVMNTLALELQEVKIYSHQTNRGGGATRNTGIKRAQGNLIFCLDSDDLLPFNTLNKMYMFWQEKRCDGIAIHKSKKFNGNNPSSVSRIDTFGYAGEQIPLQSLFEITSGVMCPLYYVFMFTKEAFEKTGGYPEDHGFDTQGFAWRFLGNHLVAFTCPNAEYLHRINFNQSYYLREYYSGKTNYNWRKIFEEFLYFFTDEVKNYILSFNIKDPTHNLLDKMQEKFGSEIILKELPKKPSVNSKIDSPYAMYFIANEYYKQGKINEALEYFMLANKSGLKIKWLAEKISICRLGIKNNLDYLTLEKLLIKRTIRSRSHPISLYYRLINKIL